jgi:acyl carrier protein
MTTDAVKAVIVEALSRIAPEIDPASLRSDRELREQLDLDSIDFLNLVMALHERLGVDIPEADYARFSTLDGAAEYLAARAAQTSHRP